MQLEAKKCLFDAQRALARIVEFTSGRQFAYYQGNALLRSAVERQFEITGEALEQFGRFDGEVLSRTTESRRIIAFRNLLIHGYADVENRIVCDVVEFKVPVLQHEIEALLRNP